MRHLKTSEASLIALALTFSASRWNALAGHMEDNAPHIAQDLHKQAENARALAAEISNAERMVLL